MSDCTAADRLRSAVRRLAVDIDHDQPRPGLGHRPRNRLADARSGAGHQR
jgi:hypothetical protein